MAIVQISQIQVRRGLDQDLPQLASGELGWSLDTRQLYIGNGTTQEGAPTEGVTKILTEYSDFLNFLNSYTFKGTDAGYTSQTGPTLSTPITRSIQSVLDEYVSVRDFGVVANGTIDDTDAINRAIQQIYVSSANGIHKNVQRTIKIPAGTYLITSPILVPPNCTLIGDGRSNTVIYSTSGTVFSLCDSYFQTGGYIGVAVGSNTPSLPSSITIRDLTAQTTSSSAPAVLVNKATDITFSDVKFVGGNYGLSVVGTSSDINVTHSYFIDYATDSVYVDPAVTGMVTRSSYFDTANITLPVGNKTITSLIGAGVVKYQITKGTDYRIGELKYNNSTGVTKFDEEYTEPGVPMTANVFANAAGYLTCNVTSTGYSIKYNLTQFI